MYTDVSISVSDTSEFPSEWLTYGSVSLASYSVDFGFGSTPIQGVFDLSYTGKGSTSFTGVTFDLSLDSSYIVHAGALVCFYPDFANSVTEIQVSNLADSLLEFWDTDGSQASSETLEKSNYYDICYDSASSVYFTVRLNDSEDGSAGAGFDLGDDFNYQSNELNSTRWTESTTEPNFQINVPSGTLQYTNENNAGRIRTNYYLIGDFDIEVDTFVSSITSESGTAQLRSVESDSNNVFAQMGIKGAFPGGGYWEASRAKKITDTSSGAASVRNLRIRTEHLSAAEEFTFVYNSSEGVWNVVSSLGNSYSDVTPGEDYLDKALSLNIVHSTTPADGAQIVYNVHVVDLALPSVPGAGEWGLGLKKQGTDIQCRYDTGAGYATLITYVDSDDFDL
jgi:hypothetical protein